MKNLFIALLILGTFLLVLPQVSHAQMGMMGGNQGQVTPSQSDISDEQSMQNAGQKIYQNLQDKKISCQNLTSSDFEKLGEYFMGQAAGSTQNHVYWDQRIQQMMGENGDTQIHTVWGQRGSGCFANTPIPSNTPSFLNGMMNYQNSNLKGGGYHMMGWGNEGNMMYGNGFGAFGIIFSLFWLVGFIDLVLLGLWLFKQLMKK